MLHRTIQRRLRATLAAAAVALALSAAGLSTAGPAAAAERYTGNLFNPGNHVAADGTVRDRNGRVVGRITEDGNGGYTLVDQDGHTVGRVEPGFSKGELVIRDDAGRRQGTLQRTRESSD
ncbi:DUF3659 domain-containing protein [Azospirillum sp. RWY-5-1]|uniref:DUF3659 domain-containing protein n=1 Tax=Azospirillum oleiclasticum TaxID=2735135 RepID=A0ABX2TCE2_9PROT|nr:DUF3659 domain-containing protein [Azospirillum oleiclasticum]NYZ15737.1 DUF3659 domain-containing protein [Azospirillum oleiclasticum]NYZ22007.1 DUF3659 domain-containing protein [Azospirillum oleiclasticum]